MRRALDSYRTNLEHGLEHCRTLAASRAYPGENLASLGEAVEREGERLRAIAAKRPERSSALA